MRWMWVDKIIEHEPGKRLVTVKNISTAEDVVHDHFPSQPTPDGQGMLHPEPIMPASLLIEGMAQTAGILVGHMNNYEEKVILGKITKAVFHHEVRPGQTVRFEAELERMDPSGASASGRVRAHDHVTGELLDVGEVELIFSHIDQNMSGLEFPEENFVFTENFETLLRDANMLKKD